MRIYPSGMAAPLPPTPVDSCESRNDSGGRVFAMLAKAGIQEGITGLALIFIAGIWPRKAIVIPEMTHVP